MLNLFGYRRVIHARSLAEFALTIAVEGGLRVIASTVTSYGGPRLFAWMLSQSSIAGYIGQITLSSRYSCRLSNGRTIVYNQSYGNRTSWFGSTYGFADQEQRDRITFDVLIRQKETLAKIASYLKPTVQLSIEFPAGLMPNALAEYIESAASASQATTTQP